MTAVHQFVRIGQHSFLSGGSLVGKDVPPYIKAARTPLSYAGVNLIGLKRRGFGVEKINHILDIYRCIYNKGLNTTVGDPDTLMKNLMQQMKEMRS